MKIKKSQLIKLIRESLGGNRLLLERKTDEVYRKFADFMYNEIALEAKNTMMIGGICVSRFDWDAPDNPSSKALTLIREAKYYHKGANKDYPGLFFQMPAKSDKEFYYNLFKKYQGYIQGLEDVIFDNDRSTFRYFLSQFTISIVAFSDSGDAAGTMNSSGDLQIYYNPAFDPNWYEKRGRPPPPSFTYASLIYVAEHQSNNLLEKGQPMQEFVVKNADDVRRVFEHEITHYVNAIRAGGRDMRSKGGMDQFDIQKQAYVDSTEEIQARLIPGQNLFLRQHAVNMDNQGMPQYLTLKGEMLRDIKKGDRQSFILKFIKHYYVAGKGERYSYDNHSEANKQRLMNRSYEFLQEVQQSQEYENFIKNNYDKLPNYSEFDPPLPDFDEEEPEYPDFGEEGPPLPDFD